MHHNLKAAGQKFITDNYYYLAVMTLSDIFVSSALFFQVVL